MPSPYLHTTLLITLCVLVHPSHLLSPRERKDTHRSECAITRRLLTSSSAGGEGDTVFDDRLSANLQDLVTIDGVQSVSLSYADYLESIQITYILSNYSNYPAPRHGILKNSEVTITLAHREFLSKVEGYHNGSVVQQITFTTEIFSLGNKTRHVYGPYGSTTGTTQFTIEGYVVGFHGSFNQYKYLTSIGMYALANLSKSEEFGGNGIYYAGLTKLSKGSGSKGMYVAAKRSRSKEFGGKGMLAKFSKSEQLGEKGNDDRFDDEPDDHYAPTSRLNSISVYTSDVLDSFKTTYSVLGGDILQSDWHGGTGGNRTDIYFTKDEAVIGIEGSTNGVYVTQLSFITRRGTDGTVTRYGPFGKVSAKAFSFYGNILGFAGSYGKLLNSISVYYT